MDPIQINVSVNVGLTPELATLLSSFLEGRKQVEPEAPKKTAKAAAERPAEEAMPAAAAEEKPAEAEAPKPTGTEPEAKEKEYTEVDVREAMDRCRKRIEGENYKEQTDSENYLKWHRKLTAQFKEISARYGSDKPSTLPDALSREQFIKTCDALEVVNDKLYSDYLPF